MVPISTGREVVVIAKLIDRGAFCTAREFGSIVFNVLQGNKLRPTKLKTIIPVLTSIMTAHAMQTAERTKNAC